MRSRRSMSALSRAIFLSISAFTSHCTVIFAGASDVVDDEVELDAPVSALPGAATARAVPPRAARPNVNRAVVLAIRVLNTDFLFS